MKSDTSFLKTIIKELHILRKTVITQWKAWKEKDLLLLANKSIEKEKIPDSHNAKEHYQSFRTLSLEERKTQNQ